MNHRVIIIGTHAAARSLAMDLCLSSSDWVLADSIIGMRGKVFDKVYVTSSVLRMRHGREILSHLVHRLLAAIDPFKILIKGNPSDCEMLKQVIDVLKLEARKEVLRAEPARPKSGVSLGAAGRFFAMV